MFLSPELLNMVVNTNTIAGPFKRTNLTKMIEVDQYVG